MPIKRTLRIGVLKPLHEAAPQVAIIRGFVLDVLPVDGELIDGVRNGLRVDRMRCWVQNQVRQEASVVVALLQVAGQQARKDSSPGGQWLILPEVLEVCVECERRRRLGGWALWTRDDKNADPAYCEPNRNDSDLKLVNKGQL